MKSFKNMYAASKMRYMLLIVIVVTTISDSQTTHTDDSINRHNYGYVMHKMHEINLATAEAKIFFYYEILRRPKVRETEAVNCSTIDNEGGGQRCNRIKVMVTRFQVIRNLAANHVSEQLKHVYEVLIDIHELMTDGITKRGILSSALGYVTGLATKQDLDRLRAAVYATDEGIETDARAWRVGTSHFVTAFKLEQKRMENIDSMLALQRQSIHELQRQIQRSFYTQHNRISFL